MHWYGTGNGAALARGIAAALAHMNSARTLTAADRITQMMRRQEI
jgi:hypothetical protein